MPLRRFLPYDVLAAGLWSITFCTLGFLFWRSIDQLTTYVSRGLFALGTLVVVIGGIVALIHLRRSPEARAKVRDWIDERDDRPGWQHAGAGSPARSGTSLLKPGRGGRRLRPPASATTRVTPGNLGLELTTLLALALVGGVQLLPARRRRCSTAGEPRIDRWAADVAERLHNDTLVERRQGRDRHRLARRSPRRSRWPRRSSPPSAGARSRPSRSSPAGCWCSPPSTSPRSPTTARARPTAFVDTFNAAYPVRPHRLRRRADRVRHRARARGRRLGGADRRRDGRRGPRRGRRRHPRLPARALPHRRARRSRAGGGDLVARGRPRAVRRTRSPQCRERR